MMIAIELSGVTPLLMNAFTDQAQIEATAATRSSLTGDRGTPQEQAESGMYRDNHGEPCIPGPNLFRCIIDAGKFFKAGKSKVTTQKSSLIPSCVELLELTIPVKHRQPWKVDTRPVRIPATGGRILRHRACFDDWQLGFTVNLNQGEMGEKLFREIMNAAGRKIGIGDFRPDCKGPFGKFEVTRWQQSE